MTDGRPHPQQVAPPITPAGQAQLTANASAAATASTAPSIQGTSSLAVGVGGVPAGGSNETLFQLLAQMNGFGGGDGMSLLAERLANISIGNTLMMRDPHGNTVRTSIDDLFAQYARAGSQQMIQLQHNLLAAGFFTTQGPQVPGVFDFHTRQATARWFEESQALGFDPQEWMDTRIARNVRNGAAEEAFGKIPERFRKRKTARAPEQLEDPENVAEAAPTVRLPDGREVPAPSAEDVAHRELLRRVYWDEVEQNPAPGFLDDHMKKNPEEFGQWIRQQDFYLNSAKGQRDQLAMRDNLSQIMAGQGDPTAIRGLFVNRQNVFGPAEVIEATIGKFGLEADPDIRTRLTNSLLSFAQERFAPGDARAQFATKYRMWLKQEFSEDGGLRQALAEQHDLNHIDDVLIDEEARRVETVAFDGRFLPTRVPRSFFSSGG